MTRGPMRGHDLAQRRDLGPAAIDRMRTAQMEMATGRGRERRGQLPADRLEADEFVILEHQLRNAVEQGARIRVERLRVGAPRGAELDDPPEIHDGDAIRDM